MSSPSAFSRIHEGRIHSGFFIFIRQLAALSDQAILARLGLEAYRDVPRVNSHDRYVVLCDVGEWTLIADDLRYSLYHDPRSPSSCRSTRSSSAPKVIAIDHLNISTS